jgi:predicted glutamine amidotransferase
MKRPLAQRLTDASYLSIHGTTDSEHLFALFRDHAKRDRTPDPAARMAKALEATIHEVQELAGSLGITHGSLLNLAVSDGKCAAISRYATGDSVAPTLYYQIGRQYECVDGVCRMRTDGHGEPTVLVASEPLTDDTNWIEVPHAHMVLIDTDRHITLQSLK